MAKENALDIEPLSYDYKVFSRIDSESSSSSIFVRNRSVAVAEADRVYDVWVIGRTFVRENYRRRGFGTTVLRELFYLLRSKGFKELMVSPGGYNTDPEILKSFYRSVGFRPIRKNYRSFVYGTYRKKL